MGYPRKRVPNFSHNPFVARAGVEDRAVPGTAPPEANPCPSPSPSGHLLGEGIEPVGLLGLGEGDSHARGERGVEHDGSALVAGSQINRGHGADALSIQNDVLWADPVPRRGEGSSAPTRRAAESRRQKSPALATAHAGWKTREGSGASPSSSRLCPKQLPCIPSCLLML